MLGEEVTGVLVASLSGRISDGWKTSGIGKCKGDFVYSDYQLCIFQKESNHLDYRGFE